MAKIIFNNKNYKVDESAIAPATTELQSHLSTEMNGEGAKIIFGGTEYGIDSTKLSAEVADFIAHLATIAGNGIRVVVGGVEYNVDPSKVAGAITELHTVFGGLHKTLAAGLYKPGAIALMSEGRQDEAVMIASWDELIDSGALTLTDGAVSIGTGMIGTKIPDNLPELNEYGFYYGVGYEMLVDGMFIRFVFNDDGSAVLTAGAEVQELPAGVIIYGDHSIDLSAMDIGVGVVSDDASMITFADAGMQFMLGETITIVGADIVLPTGGVVTSIPDGVFQYVPITGIAIAEGVTSIGKQAFYECENLVSVNISSSVTSIGTGAFQGCSSLTNVTIEEGVMSIGEDAFYNCTSLTNITIPEGVTSIGSWAFRNCNSLTNVILPNSVTSIGNSTFDRCTNLSEINFEGTMDQWNAIISGSSWSGNVLATEVQCSDGSVCINHNYVSNTIKEPTATEDALVKHTCSVCGCSYTESITPEDRGIYPSDLAGIGYTGAENETLEIPAVFQKNGTWYRTTSIGASTFSDCINITNITIPDTVKYIYSSAFMGCTNLESIIIPNSVVFMDRSAFKDCTNLTSITLPDHILRINVAVFKGCTKLALTSLPESLTTIDDNAFEGCTNLALTSLPDGVTSIGKCAFYNCSGITSITIPVGVTIIDASAFYGCINLNSITFKGTIAQWKAIQKGSTWKTGVPATYVQCSDGQAAL